MARYWRCRRVTAGKPCGELNLATKRKCHRCGKLRPAKRKPAHMAALNLPYEAWVELHGEVCGICGAIPKPGRKLHRDHDHRSGERRALLCFRCNVALRPYMDLDWMRRAVAYLERAEATREEAA